MPDAILNRRNMEEISFYWQAWVRKNALFPGKNDDFRNEAFVSTFS